MSAGQRYWSQRGRENKGSMPTVIPDQKMRISAASSVVLGLFALAVPFAYIAPAYAPPPLRHTSNDVTALLTIGDIAQVIDVSATATYLADREGMRHYADVHLTWRALKTPDKDYALGISIIGRDAEVLGNLNVQPARGNYPGRRDCRAESRADRQRTDRRCPGIRISRGGRGENAAGV